MNDLAQALAERVPGWDYAIWPTHLKGEEWFAFATRYSPPGWIYRSASEPERAVRMLNEALLAQSRACVG